MTQEQFASTIDLKQTSLASIENGRARLTEQVAEKIEYEFGGRAGGGSEWLLTGVERNRYYPVGARMVEWLKNHPKERERIWKIMEEEKEGDA